MGELGTLTQTLLPHSTSTELSPQLCKATPLSRVRASAQRGRGTQELRGPRQRLTAASPDPLRQGFPGTSGLRPECSLLEGANPMALGPRPSSRRGACTQARVQPHASTQHSAQAPLASGMFWAQGAPIIPVPAAENCPSLYRRAGAHSHGLCLLEGHNYQ